MAGLGIGVRFALALEPIALDRLGQEMQRRPRDDPGGADKAGQRARGEGAARKPEDEDLVARLVGEDEVAVGIDDIAVKAPAERAAKITVHDPGKLGDAFAGADAADIDRDLRDTDGIDRAHQLRDADDIGGRFGTRLVPGPVAKNDSPLHTRFSGNRINQ